MIHVFPQYLTSPHILDPKHLNTCEEIASVTPLDNLLHSQHFEASSRGGLKVLATLGAFALREGRDGERQSEQPC